ncbi:uncharacterized protein LOC107046167 [Diachasma alloeum]|uniref:uncharacterized protein LOC107046167 n=1 Tax=Diachasma alloeum TaxID=454923 RepID=UPI0007382C8A|nr:uncharacterized protein LOC107046167 [Diachasma alloeum]
MNKRCAAPKRTSLAEKYVKISPRQHLQTKNSSIDADEMLIDKESSGDHYVEKTMQRNVVWGTRVAEANDGRTCNSEVMNDTDRASDVNCMESIASTSSVMNDESAHDDEFEAALETSSYEAEVEVFDELIDEKIQEFINSSINTEVFTTSPTASTEGHNYDQRKHVKHVFRDFGTQTVKKWASRTLSVQTEKRSVMHDFENNLQSDPKECFFYTVSDLVQARGAHLNIPPFLKGRKRLTAQEELQTKFIAKQRIYIEHAVGRIKQFRILHRTLPLTLSGMISQIVFICACLVNFQKPIVKD